MLDSYSKLPLWLRLTFLFPLVFLNGWLLLRFMAYLEPLTSILTIAALLAFLLDFPIKFLEQRGIPKGLAIGLVALVALIVVTVLGLILIPLIIQQLSELITNLPKFIDSGSQQLKIIEDWAIAQNVPVNLESVVTQLAQKIAGIAQSLGNQVLSVVGVTISTLFSGIFVFVLTIFLLLTGDRVWNGILSWFPTPWNERLRVSIRQTFSTYFASQAFLAGILSVAQTVAFLVLKVPDGVLFGVTIGLTTLIPYASALTIVLISGLLMLQNFWLGLKVLAAAIVIGQINDNIIAPRLVGNMTGLNPVWIIISLFIGGKLGGVLGLLIAVPCASVVKIIVDTLRSEQKLEEQEKGDRELTFPSVPL
jgi:predicted PurR-regulated permease PerM